MRRLPVVLALGAACVLLGAPTAPGTPRKTTGSQCMVIYSVYRNVFSGTPTYDHQYVNLLNRCSTTVDISALNWKFRSTTSTGTFNDVCQTSGPPDPFTCMLPGGHFWLIKLNNGVGAGANPLPTPDHTEGTNIIGGSGDATVWIDDTNSASDCSGSHVDLVGFAGAVSPCAETASAGTPATNGTQAVQHVPPCKDTDNNSVDFQLVAPAPYNSTAFVTPAGANCTSGGPTLALVASASAIHTARGVLVRWRTGTELGIVGYNVYRQAARRFVRLNRTLVPGAFYASTGAAHSFLDRSAPTGRVVYRIQAVGTNGGRTWATTVTAR